MISDPDLGRCCACEARGPSVRNIVMLDKRSPTPGHGWGCVLCGLPPDGANAVLCDTCVDSSADIRFVCSGYPKDNVRVPIEECGEPFRHDEYIHAAESATCIGCACDDNHACDDPLTEACYWLRLDPEAPPRRLFDVLGRYRPLGCRRSNGGATRSCG